MIVISKTDKILMLTLYSMLLYIEIEIHHSPFGKFYMQLKIEYQSSPHSDSRHDNLTPVWINFELSQECFTSDAISGQIYVGLHYTLSSNHKLTNYEMHFLLLCFSCDYFKMKMQRFTSDIAWWWCGWRLTLGLKWVSISFSAAVLVTRWV